MNKKIYTYLASLLLIIISIFASKINVFADVPAPVDSGVLCSCVTSSAQTCASKIYGKSWYGMMNPTVYSACSSGTYSTFSIPVPPQPWYAYNIEAWTDTTYGNKNDATGDILTISPKDAGWVGFNASPIGYDTGAKCTRANGITGTLHVTGRVPFEAQGLCLVGSCSYSTAVDINYSCY